MYDYSTGFSGFEGEIGLWKMSSIRGLCVCVYRTIDDIYLGKGRIFGDGLLSWVDGFLIDNMLHNNISLGRRRTLLFWRCWKGRPAKFADQTQ
jgi:hypothetical protein